MQQKNAERRFEQVEWSKLKVENSRKNQKKISI